MNTEQKNLPPLVKGSSIYKLVVPEGVEEKIRYLLRKFPSTEWSGVLFITHEGSFENNDLIITCKDIYPMDLGNATFTEFKMNEDVASYMADNIELFDCDMALVHSHHQMSTQPSGTDINTLREEGNERNCFVSLIVNNAGKYYAAITRKIQTKSEVTVKRLGTSYEFFGEGSKEISTNDSSTTKVIDKEVIEYYDLEVIRHEVHNNLAYLDTRFEEIKEKKKLEDNNKYDKKATYNSFYDWINNNSNKDYKEGSLFGDDSNNILSSADKEKLRDLGIDWQPDKNKIHKAAISIIACSLIINTEKFDLKQWILKHMTNVYNRIFEDSGYIEENNMKFHEWRDFIIQYTLDHFDVEDVPDAVFEEPDLMQSRIAQALYNELKEFEDVNPYMQDYCATLYDYIME